MSDNTFTTSRGYQVRFQNIADLIQKLDTKYKSLMPVVPTYEIKTATGAIEKHPHDETTVQTDEERKALADYFEKKKTTEAEYVQSFMRTILIRGITADMPEGWIREQEYMGIPIPDDPFEKRIHWLETEVAATVEDAEAIVQGVLKESGANEEMLSQLADSFRHPMAKPNGNETSRPDTDGNGASVVLQHEIRASVSGIPDGEIPKRIRRGKRGG